MKTSALLNEKVSPSRLTYRLDVVRTYKVGERLHSTHGRIVYVHGFALDWVSPLTALNVIFFYVPLELGLWDHCLLKWTLWWKMVSPWQMCLPSIPPQLLQYAACVTGKHVLKMLLL